jgi:hypothetical protein
MGGKVMTKEELEKELLYKTEELNQIKEILAIFVDKVYLDVDNIVPEDLEFKLRQHEASKYNDIVQTVPLMRETLYASWIYEIKLLCQTLGWSEFSSIDTLHNITFFIKSLARENYNFKQMISKQSNGESRTDNWVSSEPTN